MWDDYRQHTFPFWEGQCDPATTLVPDAMLGPMLEGLNKTKFSMDNAALHSARERAIRKEEWPIDHTMQLVRSTWYSLGGAKWRDIFDEAHAANPTKPHSEDEAPHMKSGGRCGLDGIEYRFDGTLSDPVYMAHESGHLVAQRMGVYTQANVAEVLAFFVQIAAYDVLQRTMDDRGEAARLHRLDEAKGLERRRDEALAVIGAKDVKGMSKEDEALHYLHRHPFAEPLASVMYEYFRRKPEKERMHLLDVMFNGGDAVSLLDITSAFGINNANDFIVTGAYAGNIMKNEALALRFIEPDSFKTPAATRATL